MKTILVTGGAGMIGSWISKQLIDNGHRVVVIDDLSGGVESNVPEGARFICMDICDAPAINRLFSHIHFSAVVHCAAFASENLSHNCRVYTFNSIVIGSSVLINAAINHGIEVFVNLSSIAEYGAQVPPFLEDDIPLPCEPYGIAKNAVSMDLKSAHEFFGLNYITFRPHNVIGRRQNYADSSRNVAAIFIRQALEGKSLTIYGDGFQTRAFSPVSQVARVIAHSIDAPDTWNTAYNIGGDRVMTVLELANIVRELTGSQLPHYFLPERKEAKHAHSNHEKVKKAFWGFCDERETVEECLRDMIDEARSQTLRPIQSLPPIEIQKKLNPAWIKS